MYKKFKLITSLFLIVTILFGFFGQIITEYAQETDHINYEFQDLLKRRQNTS